ncbi:chorismate mutase [Salinifilum ghardaiensis]
MSLDDVRATIDQLDDRIVALLAQRQTQVRAAAAYKTDEDAVRAPDRRTRMMERLRTRALEEGVDPTLIEQVYTTMIDSFIELELREHRTTQ